MTSKLVVPEHVARAQRKINKELSKNVFNNKMKNFSINKIWDKLIIQQNLQGNLSNSDILHIGDKNSFDEL